MKITYTPNPLNTIIELDEHEQEVFKLKLRIHELEEDLGSAAVYLDPKNASWVMGPTPRRPQGHTTETLIEEVLDHYLDTEYMYGEGKYEGKGLDARVNELFEHFMSELKSNHVGDCTCFAMSCSKCHAESLLGLNTIKGLGKHEGHKIQSAFSYREGEVWKERSLAEAMAYLRESNLKWQTSTDTSPHAPRWKAEAGRALAWMEAYVAEHFPDHQGVAGDTEPALTQSHTAPETGTSGALSAN